MAEPETSSPAIALRRFSDAGTHKRYPRGAIITDLTVGGFNNLAAARLVRKATAEEIAAGGPGAETVAPAHPRGLVQPPPPKVKPRARKAAPNKAAPTPRLRSGQEKAGAKTPAKAPRKRS